MTGNDTLVAGSGAADTLVGGPGDDDFFSSEDLPRHRFVCDPGHDELFVDWRPGQSSVDTASCPPFLVEPFDPPALRVNRDGSVRVPVLGSTRVKRNRTVATVGFTSTARRIVSCAGEAGEV